MARIPLGGLATLNTSTHLDPQFVDLYGLRELISSPGYTAATPKLTIDSSGSFLFGATVSMSTALHSFKTSTASTYSVGMQNDAVTSPMGLLLGYSQVPNSTGSPFLTCSDGAAVRAAIRSNGGLANFSANNVNLSDERTKKDIQPLGSYWAKWKGIEFVTFKYRDQTDDIDNIGVIAQQLESVAPELVDNSGFGDTPADGVPLKAVFSSDLFHAMGKVLQECMARVEFLEARLAQIELT